MRALRINARLFILLPLIATFFYFHDLGSKSLWMDEVWVAHSIPEPTVKDMVYYKDWIQSTPPLFLVAVRLFVSVFGVSEFCCCTKAGYLVLSIPVKADTRILWQEMNTREYSR